MAAAAVPVVATGSGSLGDADAALSTPGEGARVSRATRPSDDTLLDDATASTAAMVDVRASVLDSASVELLCSVRSTRVDASSSAHSFRDLQLASWCSGGDSMTGNVTFDKAKCDCDDEEDDDDNALATLGMGRFGAALGGLDTPADGGRCNVCIVEAG